MSLKKSLFALLITVLIQPSFAGAEAINLFFPNNWKEDTARAKGIAEALAKSSGLPIQPRIAKSYPDLLGEFAKETPTIAYIGSFATAIMSVRGSIQLLGQGITGQEFYSAVMVAPTTAGNDPLAILKAAGGDVSYAKAASSGEGGAKAATEGAASIGTNGHDASLNAVKSGKAKAAFVKNHWWNANKAKFADMTALEVPGVSSLKNPDNLLVANKAVGPEMANKIKEAANANAAAFGVNSFGTATPDLLKNTLELMKKGKVDPAKYEF